MRRRRHERGGVTVEYVLLMPVLLALAGLVVSGARLWWARTTVEQLASSAARQASIARSAGEAENEARGLVHSDSVASDLRCANGWPELRLDVTGFSVPVGQPATVRATVTCEVRLADVALLPALPGTVHVESSATSTLDRFRARRP